MDPFLLNTSLFVISWHGFFSFVGVAFAVLIVAKWNNTSDVFLGKLENEIRDTIRPVRRVADEYFKDLRVREREGAPGGMPLGSGELTKTLKDLQLAPGTRVTVITRTGSVIGDTYDDPWVRETSVLHRELRHVLRGDPYSYVRTVSGEERAVFVYPIWSERPEEMTVEFQGEPGKGEEKRRVLLHRTDRWVGGAVRIEVPTGEVKNRTVDAIYGLAIWGIVGGILGSRVVHVVDEWQYYSANPQFIIAIWNGGIGLWGAILGGFLGGVFAARVYKLPVGRVADLAALGMLPAQAIGRIGDIVNGEHISKVTNMPLGFVWSNPQSPTFRSYGLVSTHPAVVYEMIWDLLLFFILWRFVRGRIKPDGMLFVAYLAFYSFGRFFIQFYRVDRLWFGGLQEAHIIALLVMAITVPLLAFKAHFVPKEEAEEPPPAPVQQRPPTRRRQRAIAN